MIIELLLIAVVTVILFQIKFQNERIDDMECDLRILVGKHDKHNVFRRRCNKNKNNKG